MGNDEKTGAGDNILRHAEQAPSDAEISHADDERISNHIEQIVGPAGEVFHELVSDRIHIDVHTVPPGDSHPYWMLVTSGMSARPMTMPAEMEDSQEWSHAELCVMLQPDWPLQEKDLEDENNYWPIRLLKGLARLPHDYATWLGWGHSIPNGDPAEPYAPGTALSGALVVPPFALGKEFFVSEGEPALHIFQVLPVTDQEMQFKVDHGLDELLELMEKQLPGIYGPIDPKRPSAV